MSDEIKTEAEFLRSAALDIVTLEPLEDSARAEVYAIDARRIAATIEALEARAEKAEAERDAAIAALSEEGRRRGEAEAKRDALRAAINRAGALACQRVSHAFIIDALKEPDT